jgi:hypothetical protein
VVVDRRSVEPLSQRVRSPRQEESEGVPGNPSALELPGHARGFVPLGHTLLSAPAMQTRSALSRFAWRHRIPQLRYRGSGPAGGPQTAQRFTSNARRSSRDSAHQSRGGSTRTSSTSRANDLKPLLPLISCLGLAVMMFVVSACLSSVDPSRGGSHFHGHVPSRAHRRRECARGRSRHASGPTALADQG